MRLFDYTGCKIIAGVILFAMVIGLTACGSSDKAGSNSTSPAEETSSTGDGIWIEQDALKSMNASDITGISVSTYTEEGALQGRVEDATAIEDIYLRILNVNIIGPSEMGVDDDGLSINVEAGSKQLSFNFEGDILVLEDGNRYEVEHLDSVKRYLRNLLEETTPAEDDDSDPAYLGGQT